jgi:hypothetical protein
MSLVPLFKSLDELRNENAADWLTSLTVKSNEIIQGWKDFALSNYKFTDIIKQVERSSGLAPTRFQIGDAYLFPIEEHFYVAVASYYSKLYTGFYERLTNFFQRERINGIVDNLNIHAHFRKADLLRTTFRLTQIEAEACVVYLTQSKGPLLKNTLLAMQVLNRFARLKGIRVEDTETVFRELITD